MCSLFSTGLVDLSLWPPTCEFFYFQPQQSILSIPSCNNVVKENLALPVTQRLRFYRLWLVSTPLWCHWTTENLNFQFNQIILHQRQIIIIILSKTKRPVAIQVMETVLHHSLLLFIHWFNMDNDYRRMDDFHLCCILVFCILKSLLARAANVQVICVFTPVTDGCYFWNSARLLISTIIWMQRRRCVLLLWVNKRSTVKWDKQHE